MQSGEFRMPTPCEAAAIVYQARRLRAAFLAAGFRAVGRRALDLGAGLGGLFAGPARA